MDGGGDPALQVPLFLRGFGEGFEEAQQVKEWDTYCAWKGPVGVDNRVVLQSSSEITVTTPPR